ncbi:alginate export family protein [Turneriella parva]|nr:alginate export family protein [Turneriella parva]
MRTMLLEPGLAVAVSKNQQLWINRVLRMGFYMRPRSEIRDNLNFSAPNPEKINRITQNSQIWFFLNPATDVEMKITLQDSRVWGGEAGVKSGNASSYDDRGVYFANGDNANSRAETSVREAWLRYTNIGVTGLGVQVGRQVLAYGDQRMLGGANWNVTGLSFDGLVVKLDTRYFASDAILVRGTSKDSGTNGITSETSVYDDSYLAGFYNTLKPGMVVVDVYGLGLFRHLSPESIVGTTALSSSQQQSNLYTFGARVTNRTAANKLPVGSKWDITLEAAFQAGNAPDVYFTNTAGNVVSNSRTYKGKFFFAQTGYKVLDEMRVGAHVYYSPGTTDRTSGSLDTFQTLPGPRFGGFPYLNVFNGISENMGMKNIFAPAVSVSYENKLLGEFILTYLYENKATTQDAWYAISGAANSSATTNSAARVSTEDAANTGAVALGRNVFQELDLVYLKQFSAYVSLWVGIGYLHAGDAVRLARGADFKADAFMSFIQITGLI